MRAPDFWWLEQPNFAATLLSPAAHAYGAMVTKIMQRKGEKVKVPVICIGNFVAGGAGKTPTAIAVAHLLREMEQTPFFLSRGYGGALSTSESVQVDPTLHTATDVGDEPLLLARHAPTLICADRIAGARAAVEAGASVIVMDDGLQNPSLAKDLSIAVVDAAVGIGNGLCMPAGPLRAPMTTQWRAIQALVIVGQGKAGERLAERAFVAGRDPVQAHLAPDAGIAANLRGERVFAFAGIGRPEKFFETLRDCGAEIVGTHAFADHQPYRDSDLALILSRAAELDVQLIVTTEKDAVRITPGAIPDLVTLPVSMVFQDGQHLRALLAGLFRAG